jgi:hypothetical protein
MGLPQKTLAASPDVCYGSAANGKAQANQEGTGGCTSLTVLYGLVPTTVYCACGGKISEARTFAF